MRMNNANLQRQMKSGTINFCWIAGLSTANSIFFVFVTRTNFVVGLGITQFMDTLTHNIAQSFPNSMLLALDKLKKIIPEAASNPALPRNIGY
jgi:hypothetical protein